MRTFITFQAHSAKAKQRLEREKPGSLECNCGYCMWRTRYTTSSQAADAEADAIRPPYPIAGGSRTSWADDAYALDEWCIDIQTAPAEDVVPTRLIGVTEDIICDAANEHASGRACRLLCHSCQVPICKECRVGLYAYEVRHNRSTIPMALANDHMYGYVAKLLI